jgi:hypothetical protein
MAGHAFPEEGEYRVSNRHEVAASAEHRRPSMRVFVDRRRPRIIHMQCIIGVFLMVNASNIATCRSWFPRCDWVSRQQIAYG